jgi:CubicO group peptidase (beta-lactamase class C family)
MKSRVLLTTRFCLPLFLVALVILPLWADSLPTGKPEDAGFSSERLLRIHEAIQRHIDAGDISGAVTLVARKGKIIHVQAHGFMDIEAKKPMQRDTIFLLASMSKPITAIAVLTLIEQGKLRLDDPVSRYIPEFAHMNVASVKNPSGLGPGAPDQDVSLTPASREIIIRDLLEHVSGLGSNGAGGRQLAKIAPRGSNDTLAGYIPKLASVPLDFQPGTQWRYSPTAGFEVLSRVVEIASGQAFDQYLKQHIFDPLGMKDTVFVLSGDRQSRLVSRYQRTPNGLQKAPTSPFTGDTYFSGAAGLASTIDDYALFAQMLLNGGQLNGKRIVSPKTIAFMTANHVVDLFNEAKFNGFPGRGFGYGFGVAVMLDPVAAEMRVSPGAFGWDGAYGTKVWVDPKESMIEILLMQTSNFQTHRDFENAVMQALIE